MNKKIYYVDIDNTICRTDGMNYLEAQPIQERIDKINQLYDEGHTIVYWTARGSGTQMDWRWHSKFQLEKWGCKYHEFKDGKPVYDIFIDDKAFNDKEFFNDKIS